MTIKVREINKLKMNEIYEPFDHIDDVMTRQNEKKKKMFLLLKPV